MRVLFQGSALEKRVPKSWSANETETVQIALVISKRGAFYLNVLIDDKPNIQKKSFHHLPADSRHLVILWRMVEMLSAVESLGRKDINLAFVAAGGQISDLPKKQQSRQGDINEFIGRIRENYWQIMRKPIPLIIIAAIERYSLPENGK